MWVLTVFVDYVGSGRTVAADRTDVRPSIIESDELFRPAFQAVVFGLFFKAWCPRTKRLRDTTRKTQQKKNDSLGQSSLAGFQPSHTRQEKWCSQIWHLGSCKCCVSSLDRRFLLVPFLMMRQSSCHYNACQVASRSHTSGHLGSRPIKG